MCEFYHIGPYSRALWHRQRHNIGRPQSSGRNGIYTTVSLRQHSLFQCLSTNIPELYAFCARSMCVAMALIESIKALHLCVSIHPWTILGNVRFNSEYMQTDIRMCCAVCSISQSQNYARFVAKFSTANIMRLVNGIWSDIKQEFNWYCLVYTWMSHLGEREFCSPVIDGPCSGTIRLSIPSELKRNGMPGFPEVFSV